MSTKGDDDEVFRDGVRSAHGKAKKSGAGIVVEVPPADELGPGVPAPPAEESAPIPRRANGQFDGANAAKAAGARGGNKTSRNRRLGAGFGADLRKVLLRCQPPGVVFEPKAQLLPMIREADAAFLARLEELVTWFGPELSSGVVATTRSEKLAHYSSRILFEAAWGGLFLMHSKTPGLHPNVELLQAATRLADSASQLQLKAWHLARLEALSRRERDNANGQSLVVRNILGDDS